VSEWIAEHLQQIDGLQIRHFVPHPAIKKWQLRGKQLCEGVPAPEQFFTSSMTVPEEFQDTARSPAWRQVGFANHVL
jgi:hypothetical protein